MTLDFRANQVRTNKIISSGSTGTNASILFYDIEAEDSTAPNTGIIDPTKFNTGSIGDDVYFYVSGTKYQVSYGPPLDKRKAVFGGDVVVSGTFSSGMTPYVLPVGFYVSTPALTASPQVVGQVQYDPAEMPNATVYLRTILSIATDSYTPGCTASVKLYSYGDNDYVEIGGPGITVLETVLGYPSIQVSVDLCTALNFSANASNYYEVQVFTSNAAAEAVHGSSYLACFGG